MLELHYTGDTLLMADAVGEAVMRYASALADSQGSDVVVVPVINARGEASFAEILLGPASQLYATPAPDAAEVEVDAEVIADINRRARRLQPSLAQPFERPERASFFDTDLT